jgi:hypothetical protein
VLRQLYTRSFFGFSHKRGGWDCLRHNDILAAGSVPFFGDLHHIPRNTMAHYPKKLFAEALKLPGIEHVVRNDKSRFWKRANFGWNPDKNLINYQTRGTIDHAKFDLAKYYDLADRMLNYTRHHSTAEALIANLLRVIGATPPRRVLYVSREGYDYTELTAISGLVGLGIPTTIVGLRLDGLFQMESDHPLTRAERDARYNAEAKRDPHTMYGHGFSYGMRMPTSVLERKIWRANDPEMKARIATGEFDVAICSLRKDRDPDYFNELRAANVKFAFVEWDDIPGGHHDLSPYVTRMCPHGPTFHREMSDRSC